jgi:hypothetical protein
MGDEQDGTYHHHHRQAPELPRVAAEAMHAAGSSTKFLHSISHAIDSTMNTIMRDSHAAAEAAAPEALVVREGSEGSTTSSLVEQLGTAWRHRPPPGRIAEAAKVFDARHAQALTRADALHHGVHHSPCSLSRRAAFERSLFEMRTNRYVVRERAKRVKKIEARVVKKRGWRLEESIWAPRVHWSDSKDFYDSEKVAKAMFEVDWRRALQYGLVKFICRYDDGESDSEEEEEEEEEEQRAGEQAGDGESSLWGQAATTSRQQAVAPTSSMEARSMEAPASDEVEDVGEVLWEHATLVRNMFDTYAAIGTSGDIFSIQFNAFSEWVNDCGLVNSESVHTMKSSWDMMFLAVDSASRNEAAGNAGAGSKKAKKSARAQLSAMDKALDRSEFLQCIVKAAVMTYVMTGELADISLAVDALFERILCPKTEPSLSVAANDYRRTIYIEEIDVVLRRHEAALRMLYAGTCALEQSSSLLGNKTVSIHGWRTFARRCGLVDLDLTERDATLCFSFSRMLVVDAERDSKSGVKRTHLSFEDFLECLCRCAALKGFPTDDEIAQAAAEGDGKAAGSPPNAGSLLLHMAKVEPAQYESLLRERALPWGEPPTIQPLHRCVEHLIHVVVVFFQGGRRRTATDFHLTPRQVRWGFQSSRDRRD